MGMIVYTGIETVNLVRKSPFATGAVRRKDEAECAARSLRRPARARDHRGDSLRGALSDPVGALRAPALCIAARDGCSLRRNRRRRRAQRLEQLRLLFRGLLLGIHRGRPVASASRRRHQRLAARLAPHRGRAGLPVVRRLRVDQLGGRLASPCSVECDARTNREPAHCPRAAQLQIHLPSSLSSIICDMCTLPPAIEVRFFYRFQVVVPVTRSLDQEGSQQGTPARLLRPQISIRCLPRTRYATMSISVGAAGKVGDGVNAYYVFKVTSETFSVDPIQVDRRYSDFLWLHTQLARQCAGYIIPPLPAKVVPLLQGPEFLERRRAGLEKFLRKVVEHDELKNTNYFKSFLECSPVELTAIKAEAQKHENAPASGLSQNMAQKSQQLNSWWGKAYQRMAENDKVKMLAAKAGRDLNSANVIEDPEFDKLNKYVTELYTLVKGMQTRAENAHKQNRLAAGAYCDLIECMCSIADIEQSSPSGASSSAPSDFGAVLSLLDTRARLIDAELAEFSESVDYFTRWVGAVVSAVNVREDRRYVYQAKLAAKNQNNNNASQELMEAKEEFERVHARVVSEVKRFQVEKSVELRRLFAQYAKLQVQTHAELGGVVEVANKALDGPMGDQPVAYTAKRPFFQPSTANNQKEDDLSDSMSKVGVRHAESTMATKKDPTPGNETADLYSDVCL